MTRALVLNGPNLSLLGVREPEVYGSLTAADLADAVAGWAGELGIETETRFTNSEAELVEWIHAAVGTGEAVVLNAAAFTHYSYALRDALATLTGTGSTVIEVHISNPAAREEFRHTSVIAGVCTGTIAGFGFDSYRLALSQIARG